MLRVAQDRAVPVRGGSWVFLGHVHLLMSFPGRSLCLIYPWASQPGLLLCGFTCLKRLNQGEQHECHPWILAGDILCIITITGATVGWDHPWLSQLIKITNEIISWQISTASFGPAWHQFLCGVLTDLKSSEALSPCLTLVKQYAYGRLDGQEGSFSFTNLPALLWH